MAQLLAAGTWRWLDSRLRLWTTTTRSNVRRPQLQILSLTLVRLLEAADDTLRDEIAGTLRECADTVLERAQVLPSRCGHRQLQPYTPSPWPCARRTTRPPTPSPTNSACPDGC